MAHTIQRGKVLSSLAESGHVGTFYRKLDGIANTNKLKAGIEKRASVFYGFCSYHDTELFKNIELHEFTKTKENCWASSYRAVCHEFYQKNAAIEVTNWQRDNLDNGLDTYLQVFVQEKIFLHQRDVTKGFDDISLIKKNYEEIKVTSSFDDLISYVFEYDSPLTIAVCACISPFFDINNKKIQNKGNGKESFQHLSLSTVTINGKAAYVISHLKKHDVIGKYLEEVLSKPLEYINNWLMTCIFAYTENNYFRLSWWDSLDISTKDEIYNLFLSENYTRIINYDTPVGQSIPCKLIAVERI
ncbi:metal-binding protein [Aeromonas sobria]|uniref:metal-binding protein n=1 Tax=Aeromonas sobria TaxID=646 RepID=UPI0011DF3971|nr:metal-binding protein [Aeromonas sobria]